MIDGYNVLANIRGFKYNLALLFKHNKTSFREHGVKLLGCHGRILKTEGQLIVHHVIVLHRGFGPHNCNMFCIRARKSINAHSYYWYTTPRGSITFVQLYHCEIKLYSMKWWWCPLYTWPTCLVGSYLNNSPRIDMSFHSDTLNWLRSNQSLLLLFNAVCSA
jgi:hypothetical protein